jgi:phage tail-like protein
MSVPSRRQQGWLLRRLPINMQDDRVMRGLLGIIEEVAESVQLQADQIQYISDPSVTPEHLLGWLGRFVDAPDTETLPVADRRELLADVGALILRKGTKDYVATLVRPFTSGAVEVLDDGGIYRDGEAGRCEGRVVVRVGEVTHGTPDDLLHVIRSIIPAHCVVRLDVNGVPHLPEAA